jgi:SWI/SNF-related matrix-associated actin-dependent regulator 1 of chromatin subfamily A
MKLPLRSHQKHCHDVLWSKRYGMDCSEPGCGKTATAMSIIERSGLQAVVIVPAYLARNWESEIHKFTNLTCAVFSSKVKSYPVDVLIVSYALLEKAKLPLRGRKIVVCDEAHYLSNPTARRTRAVKSFINVTKPERVILMSGTFLRNSVGELWSPLSICDLGHNRSFRENFKSHYSFKDTFQHRTQKFIYGRRIVQWEGSRNEEYLRKWLDAYSVTVKLSQLTELPPILKIPLVAAPPDPAIDKELMEAYTAYQRGEIGNANIHSIKRLSAVAKVPYTLAFAQELLEQGLGPVVLFSDHVEPTVRMAEALGIKYKCGLVHGEIAGQRRQDIVNAFQSGRLDLIIATIGSMSLGVTLTKACIVIFNDLNFDPTKNRQAEGRIYRISQKADKVLSYTVMRAGVDERICELLEDKLAITSRVLEEYEGADLDW